MEKDLFKLLVPSVGAQGLDAISEPTFGRIDLADNGNITSTIFLKTERTSLAVGEKVKLTVSISTGDISITEYKIVIQYDQSKLSVVDSDTNTIGSQVKLLDTIFKVTNSETDNRVEAGKITLIASSVDALSVNRDVAEIEFQSQSVGSTTIRVTTGVEGSQLIRSTGSGVLYNPNEITLQINTTNTNPPVVTNPDNGNSSIDTSVKVIPVTSIESDIITAIPVMVGFILVVSGIKLLNSRSKLKRN